MVALDVVVIGLNVVDALVALPADVCRGEKHGVDGMVLQGGGPAGNAACLLARLGWRTGLLTRMGNDPLCQVARADFSRYGVRDDIFIEDETARPAFAVVQIDAHDGSRTVFYSLQGYRPLAADDVPNDVIASARLVLTDGYEATAAIQALAIARDSGVPSVVDLEDGPPEDHRAILQLATDAILPMNAARRLTGQRRAGDVLQALARHTNAQVIVTDGVRGSWAWTGSGAHHQRAFAMQVVDTTGCGDAYHGAYASALLDGQPLERRMEFASYIASHAAQQLGGRGFLTNRRSWFPSAPMRLPGRLEALIAADE